MIPAVSSISSQLSAGAASHPAVTLSAGEAARRLEVQSQPGAAESASSVVTISAEAGAPAQAVQAAKAAQAAQPALLAGKSALAFAPADANQDDKVTELERWVYDLTHPEPKPKPESKAESKAEPGPAPQAAEIGRAAGAELKAYEAVARAGRNL